MREFTQGSVNSNGIFKAVGEWRMTFIREDGSFVDHGVVSRRIVTDAALTYFAAAMVSGGATASAFNHFRSGTGTAAETAADSELQTPVGTRLTGTQSSALGVYSTTCTIPYTAGYTITEVAIHSASTSGTCLDRALVTAQAVTNGQAIKFDYTLTLTRA